MEISRKQLIKRFYDSFFVTWDWSLVDQFIHPDFVSHDWGEEMKGPEGFRQFYERTRSVFPDCYYIVDDLLAEGDRVIVRWRLKGSHGGGFLGIEESGQPFSMNGIAIYRVENGMAMERWVVYDYHGLVTQIRGSN